MLKHSLIRLETQKIKRTPLREALLALFHASDAPLSIPGLQKSLPRKNRRVNKTSLYRNLELLERAGLVEKVSVSDETRYYELSERTHHHHLICQNCGRIFDLPLEESKLLDAAEIFSAKLNFNISRHAVEFYGRCEKCQGRAVSEKTKIESMSIKKI